MERHSISKQNTSLYHLRCNVIIVSLLLAFGISIGLSGVALAKDPSKQEQQAEIRNMAKETLARLYKEQPAAKSGSEGGDLAGAIAVDVDILLYQLTDDGLALELTGKGTKYYKDDDLN